MEFSYRTIGIGILIAVIVLVFTFTTSLIAGYIQNYNLGISLAFAMGGLFCICLSVVLNKIYLLG